MYILETPRLILRPPSRSDELLLHGLHSDPFVVNAVGDGVYPALEQSKAALLQFINHWQHNHFGLWMVFVKDEGEARKFAGYCGLMCSGPNLPEDPHNVELVYCFHLAAAGHGIAPEAGRATLRFAFERLTLEKVTAFIRPTNTRALSAAPKVGLCYVRDRICNNMMMQYFEVFPTTVVQTDELLVSAYTDPDVIPDQ
ncbi:MULTISPECIES: GNAT family N-acetyltransferase [Mesorhizobium]|uniref:Protein N-acetyltransferase, RimJ/RimL family n=1 Tax=Mesorhizobium muleiense TaxID=1004279 RepID=A0A1G9L234_9HYPH|nr:MULTISPECIES: GNAT family N-acetyltransferase [Mesorhizobium]MCF6102111.1 GNAT family N-acetyltransferase [Mesorhizobium muleiense]RUV29483.1 N-acetyltransferase [Mesorhizobium sp. M5C.F.Ca.IN.020.32.2.1]RWP09577.1 MAG: N-acetyltransferase [Mesorhizobium sp.]TIL82069.1 MAG: GNAT family N-acetyltransferase [Mesorhizobium sp.]TIU95463.1 MAG: GNAT family N-acetyltransferase [Mesorhizobium sp.]